ncbi:unnamed protein product [Rhodiola kirilowii]
MVSLKLQKRLAASVMNCGREKCGWIQMKSVKSPWPTPAKTLGSW